MKILMILTSHDKLGDTNKSTGFWLEEFATPFYIFKDAGAEITIASPQGGQPPLDPISVEEEYQSDSTKRFQQDSKSNLKLNNSILLEDIDPNKFNAVFYPGGHGPLWDLVDNKHSIHIIEHMWAAGKPVAAICHGPCVFKNTIKPDQSFLVAGKNVTSFSNSEEVAVNLTDTVPFLVESMLTGNGASYTCADDFNEHCVVDDNLITGQNPASSEKTAYSVIGQLS